MKTIMIVDDEVMITKTLSMLLKLRTKHKIIVFNNPKDALNSEELKENKVDVIVSDFIMPDMNGIEFLLDVKQISPKSESILLTGYADKENAIKSINEVGVYYYLEKPWNNEELVKIVFNALDKKSLADELDNKIEDLEKSNLEVNRLYELMRNNYDQEIEGSKSLMISLANVIEARDEYTDGHTRRVSMIASAIGKRLELSKEDLETLEMVGVIHDIGKVSVDDAILNKPGKLSYEEFEIMKNHPVIGEKICRSMKMLSPCLVPILHHHEKLDGSGYPSGLKGDEIDIVTRIITIADIFDALFSERPYRKKLDYDAVKDIMLKDVEAGRTDGEITEILFDLIESNTLEF